jgi:hypothetical protein
MITVSKIPYKPANNTIYKHSFTNTKYQQIIHHILHKINDVSEMIILCDEYKYTVEIGIKPIWFDIPRKYRFIMMEFKYVAKLAALKARKLYPDNTRDFISYSTNNQQLHLQWCKFNIHMDTTKEADKMLFSFVEGEALIYHYIVKEFSKQILKMNTHIINLKLALFETDYVDSFDNYIKDYLLEDIC